MTKIVIIHGYDSSGETSSTVKKLTEMFLDHDHTIEVVAPSYKENMPVETMEYISSLVDENTIVIGSSLGGFIARYVANHCNALKLIMINPSIQAYDNLKKYIGDGKMDLESCNAYKPYYVVEDDPELDIMVLLASNDDVVNPNVTYDIYKDRAVLWYGNGGHRMADLVDYKEEIVKFINIVHD